MSAPVDNVIIIGAGQAGARAALALREREWKGDILLLGDEPLLPYERPPLSKEVLTARVAAGEARIANGADYVAQDIDLQPGTRVVAIDLERYSVLLADGRSFAFARLILATGARARPLTVPGADLLGVHYLRDARDAHTLRTALESAKRVAIIGGGFVGLEVAAAARAFGLPVTVLEQAPVCLGRVLPAASADPILRRHLANGVDVRCNSAVAALEGNGRVQRVVLADGTEIDADLVVVGVGSLANDELARAAGIECANGVVVDRDCRSSAPFVYAIGDVASRRELSTDRPIRLESWENAEKQALEVAAAITSGIRPESSAPWFWTDQFDLNVQMIGMPGLDDDLVVRSYSEAQFVHFYMRQGVLTGAVLFNSGRDKRIVTKLVGSRLSSAQLGDHRYPLKQLTAVEA